MRYEILHWGGEILSISGGHNHRKIAASTEFEDTVLLPDHATVILNQSTPNWGGYKGITLFVNQTPAVLAKGVRGLERKPFSQADAKLFGRVASIYPGGLFFPAQLPEILEYVQQHWNWDIDERVRRLVKAGQPLRS